MNYHYAQRNHSQERNCTLLRDRRLKSRVDTFAVILSKEVTFLLYTLSQPLRFPRGPLVFPFSIDPALRFCSSVERQERRIAKCIAGHKYKQKERRKLRHNNYEKTKPKHVQPGSQNQGLSASQSVNKPQHQKRRQNIYVQNGVMVVRPFLYSRCTKSNTRFRVLKWLMLKIDSLWDGTLCPMGSSYWYFMGWWTVS
jgi:hypothetical protein